MTRLGEGARLATQPARSHRTAFRAARFLAGVLALPLAAILAACGTSSPAPRAGGAAAVSPSPSPSTGPAGGPTPSPSTGPAGGPTPSAAPGAGGGAAPAVEVVDTAFEPSQQTVAVGATVTWRQAGVQPHSVTSVDGAFDSSPGCGPVSPEECLRQGSIYPYTFTRTGTYPYYCRVHGTATGVGMTGTVVVR